MKAMAIEEMADISKDRDALVPLELEVPQPANNEVLIRISCCGVCHTEMDEIEGRLPPSELPRIPGHQAVGRVVAMGADVTKHVMGERVGVAWIFSSCGTCEYCLRGDNNLCPDYKATGKDAQGGYAEYMVIPEQCAFKLPDSISDVAAAPLLCAGAIGYRSLRLANIQDGNSLGLTGFGASAHLMMQMIKDVYPNSRVYVFARQQEEREFALALGATWAGATDDIPDELLHAIIDTTPAWFPILKAMECLRPGGRLVINAIRKEANDLAVMSQLNYEQHLWQEKEIKSVANVSARDVSEFLTLAGEIDVQAEIQTYPLSEANAALRSLRFDAVKGAKVLICEPV